MPHRTGAGDSSSGSPAAKGGETLRRLASGFVHEVNNALNPIMAAIHLLEVKAGDPEAVREITARLKATAEELAKQSAMMGAMLRSGEGAAAPAPAPARAKGPAASDAPVPDPITRKALADAPTRRIRVLVADDAAGDRSLLGALLVELGFEVVAQATNGDEAVRLVDQHHPDAVLLDVHMPGSDGLEAAGRITTLDRDVAVVLFSGDGALTLTDDAVQGTSAVAFLPKPAPPSIIAGTLRLAVQRSRELRTARAEASDARQQVANRKIIERAKGLLQERMGISEQEAYRFLQKTSQNRAVALVEIAKVVLDGEALVAP